MAEDEIVNEIYMDYYMIGHYVQLAVTLFSFIYGVTSWCLIKKFRIFNNYVYINVILVNLIRLIVMSLPLVNYMYIAVFLRSRALHFFIFMFLSAVFNYWLVVMCYMFYVDIVKVFNGDIKRRYMKSFLFAWGVPSITFLMGRLILLFNDKEEFAVIFVDFGIFVICNVLPAVINLALFIKLVFSLFPYKNTNACVTLPKNERRRQILSRLCTATAMFALSNIFVLMMLIWDCLQFALLKRAFTFCLQIVILALFVPLVKSNRILWYDYYKNRLKRNLW